MSDFSQPPETVLAANVAKGFVGMHIMQGVPILDRDLNLLADLVAANVRALVSRYVGAGVALGSGAFAIAEVAADNDFRISAGVSPPGFCLVEGIEVSIAADVNHSAQPPLDSAAPPGLTTPAGADRTDKVFLEVFLESVDTDDILANDADIALQTSVRLRPAWRVRVAEGGVTPDVTAGHHRLPLATIARKQADPRIRASMITDTRPTCLSLPTVRDLLIRPAITGLSAGSGGPGLPVTITGRNLDLFGRPRVTFGAFEVPASDVSPVTATSVGVKVPAGMPAGRVKVTLFNSGGSADAPAQFTVVTS